MLKKLILESRNDPDKMVELIAKFTPIIQSRARWLGYPEAEQDMTCELIFLVHEIDLERISSNEGALVNYISRSLHNSFIKLSKRRNKETSQLTSIELISLNPHTHDSADNLFFWELVRHSLNENEFEIIFFRFVAGYTDSELAQMRNISRQSVNKTKRNALKKLSKILSDYFTN